jgi:hypothetical protein
MRETIDMAREAGFIIDESLGVPYALIKEKTFVEFNVALERLVELARADKREACAVLCDQLSDSSRDLRFGAAIRARGQA